MRVDELMTKEVRTVAPETTLKEVAELLVRHGISGLPVCDTDGRVLGVVSEADILLKERGTDTSGAPRAVFSGRRRVPPKASARTAGEAMTSPAVTISPFRSVHEAARLMIEHRVNRLPVVRNDEILGIVTRADFVRAFQRHDHEIALEISDDILKRTVWLDPGQVAVRVDAGEVTLRGKVEGRSDAQLIERLVARVAGVVGVTSELTWRVDDTSRKYQRRLTRMKA
jgi:CBS domain-containing protein